MESIIKLHLSVLLGTLLPIPFGNLVLPYIYWKLECKKNSTNEFSIQACNILNFQLLFNILFYTFMTILWYSFILKMQNNFTPNYIIMVYPTISLLCVTIVYPVIIALHLYVKKKNINYYPNIIRLFKY